MHRILAAAIAISTIATTRPCWACGAPIQTAPGYAGTALAEGADQVSVFTASASGYAWDRLQLSTGQRTHVADVAGTLSGNIETDARSTRAIAAQDGALIELSPSGVVPVSADPAAATTVFGAALDPSGNWQVLAYDEVHQALTLFSETTAGAFQKVDTLSAACGTPEMLDAVVEPDGTFVGLCAGEPVLLKDGALQLGELPTPAMALGRAEDGDAVFYGPSSHVDEALVRMRRSGASWSIDDTIDTAPYHVNWLIPVSDHSILESVDSGFVAVSRNADGSWQASPLLTDVPNVTSAFGAPAQVLDGQYELTLYSSNGASWQAKDLGPMGTAPTYRDPPGGLFGCTSAGGGELLPLALVLGLFAASRKRGARAV